MNNQIQLTPEEREKIMASLIKAGAVKREKPLTQNDSYFSRSIGPKGEKIPKIKF